MRTERLLLRRWSDEDREPFAAMNADPAVMRYFPRTLTRAESDAFVDRIDGQFEEIGYGLWAVSVVGVPRRGTRWRRTCFTGCAGRVVDGSHQRSCRCSWKATSV